MKLSRQAGAVKNTNIMSVNSVSRPQLLRTVMEMLLRLLVRQYNSYQVFDQPDKVMELYSGLQSRKGFITIYINDELSNCISSRNC